MDRKDQLKETENRLKNLKLMEAPEVQSWRALLAAFQSIFSFLEEELGREGCSISRFQILLILYTEGPCQASKLADRLLVTRGNVSMFVRRMEKDGLLTKVLIPNQKRYLLQLTTKGSEYFQSLFPRHIKRIKKKMPPLPKDFLKILQLISNPK